MNESNLMKQIVYLRLLPFHEGRIAGFGNWGQLTAECNRITIEKNFDGLYSIHVTENCQDENFTSSLIARSSIISSPVVLIPIMKGTGA
mgnify:FL=1